MYTVTTAPPVVGFFHIAHPITNSLSSLLEDYPPERSFGNNTIFSLEPDAEHATHTDVVTLAIRKSLKTPRDLPPSIQRLLICVNLV